MRKVPIHSLTMISTFSGNCKSSILPRITFILLDNPLDATTNSVHSESELASTA